MALLEVPATRTALLALKRQLAFAEEGHSLLDRKRELLLLELQARRARAAAARREAGELLGSAFSALRCALLDAGSAAVDRASLGAPPCGAVGIRERRLMGVRLAEASYTAEAAEAVFGPAGTPSAADAARRRFSAALPRLAGLAGLETSAFRLAREHRRTQRRCNALSKKVIPDCRQTLSFLAAALEEREREYVVMLRSVRGRVRAV